MIKNWLDKDIWEMHNQVHLNSIDKEKLNILTEHWNQFIPGYFKDKRHMIDTVLNNYEYNKLRNLIEERFEIVPIEALEKLSLKRFSINVLDRNRYTNEIGKVSVNLWFEIEGKRDYLSFYSIINNFASTNMEITKEEFMNYNHDTHDYYKLNLLYPEDEKMFSNIAINFVLAFLNYMEDAIHCEVVSSREVARDFPELFEKTHQGKKLSDSYYIRLNSEEVLEAGFLVDGHIDLLLGAKGAYHQVAIKHNAYNDNGDYYYVNYWDAIQVVETIKSQLQKLGIACY